MGELTTWDILSSLLSRNSPTLDALLGFIVSISTVSVSNVSTSHRLRFGANLLTISSISTLEHVESLLRPTNSSASSLVSSKSPESSQTSDTLELLLAPLLFGVSAEVTLVVLPLALDDISSSWSSASSRFLVIELLTNLREVSSCLEKVPTRAFFHTMLKMYLDSVCFVRIFVDMCPNVSMPV